MSFAADRVAEGLRRSAAGEWRAADAVWAELAASHANPLVAWFAMQAAVGIGEGSRALALAAGLHPALLASSALRRAVRGAEDLAELQARCPVPADLAGRPLGRFLMETRRNAQALRHWMDLAEPRAADERALRLTELHARLGEDEAALAQVAACAGGPYAARAEEIGRRCAERREGARQAPDPLPRRLLRDLRADEAAPDGMGQAQAALVALAWGGLSGEWDGMAAVLRRATLAQNEGLLALVDAPAEALLGQFIASPAFAARAGGPARDHLGRCCIASRLYRALDGLLEHDVSTSPGGWCDPSMPAEDIRRPVATTGDPDRPAESWPEAPATTSPARP